MRLNLSNNPQIALAQLRRFNFVSPEELALANLEWVPVLTGFSVNPTNSTYRYKVIGNLCTVFVAQDGAGTSNATTFTISAPLPAALVNKGVIQWGNCFYQGTDNGAILVIPGNAYINSNTQKFILSKDISGSTNWTNVNGKAASFQLTYEVDL